MEQERLQQSLVSVSIVAQELGEKQLSFGVFCSVPLSQEPQPVVDAMQVMQEAKGLERGDDSDLRSGRCHRDAENVSIWWMEPLGREGKRHDEMRAAGE